MRLLSLLFFLIVSLSVFGQVQKGSVVGRVVDAEYGQPLCGVGILIVGTSQGSVSDDLGRFQINGLASGSVRLGVFFLGYEPQTIEVEVDADPFVVRLAPSDIKINEVVVTAHERRGVVASSLISREHMDHVQPSSLSDVMSLLPGGLATDPSLSKVNSIQLREVGGPHSYSALSALGTLFVVDGAPINTDANMQTTGLPEEQISSSRNQTNSGVDMRSISTDDIESIEIVRGIPSVEYGNLTSGLVNIARTRKPTPWTARVKVDMASKLLSVGNGVVLTSADDKSAVLNVNLGVLDSKADPRNNLENYKRFTASARVTMHCQKSGWSLDWTPAADFCGSFDNVKNDPDISFSGVDKYVSAYRRASFSNSLAVRGNRSWFKNVSWLVAASLQKDRLERVKLMSPPRATVALSNLDAASVERSLASGEGIPSWGSFVLGEYVAEYVCDGRPLCANSKLKLDFARLDRPALSLDSKVGWEWGFAKNFGSGTSFDVARPLSTTLVSRPRSYRSIPAVQNMAAFAEVVAESHWGGVSLQTQLGLRWQSLLGLPNGYAINRHPYWEPRLNLLLSLPSMAGLHIALGGGYGKTHRLPTQDYLFPEVCYHDIVQLSRFDAQDPAHNSVVGLLTYAVDAANKGLRAACNDKWEVRADLDFRGHRLSVTYFQERMRSGFRKAKSFVAMAYKDYEAPSYGLSLSASEMASLPYRDCAVLRDVPRPTNGSRIDKDGVEYQFQSARIRPILTSVVVNGAWFRSVYSNSDPFFYPISQVVGDGALRDSFVGLYDESEGNLVEQFNTNFMLDTQIPLIGFVFSTSIENVWYSSNRKLFQSGVPVAYVAASDGQLHPFSNDDVQADYRLGYLVRHFASGYFTSQRVPRATYVHLKTTKMLLSNALRVSVFVNRMLTSTPDYVVDGLTVRRHAKPYFGMELNLAFK